MRAGLAMAALVAMLAGCAAGGGAQLPLSVGELGGSGQPPGFGHATWDQATTILCKKWPPARAEMSDCTTVFAPVIAALFSQSKDASRGRLLSAAKESLHLLAPYEGISPGRQGPGQRSIAAGALFGLQVEELNDSMAGYEPTRVQILETAMVHAFPKP